MNTAKLFRRAIACVWLALMLLPLAGYAAELSGTITAAANGTPLQGIEVQARYDENSWIGTTTGSDGKYQFLLPAGTYRIRIEDNNLNTFIPEWYDNAASYASATPFVLADSDVVTGVDASLAEGGHLIGNITADTGGAPLSNIRVAVFRATNPSLSNWQEVKSRLSLSNGSYDLGGLPEGTYRLRFSDDAGNYAPEHHNNQIEFDLSDGISLLAGGTVTTNASLGNAFNIQGTVRDESANPLAGIYVYAYRNNGSGTWNYVSNITTQTNGSYDLKGLTAGEHRIGFYDASGLHRLEYYNDVTDLNVATILPLVTGGPVPVCNAALAGAGLIKGTITDGSLAVIPNIYVGVYRFHPTLLFWESVGSAYTDGDGKYSVGGLESGDYKVGALDNSGAYKEKYYNEKPDIESADYVSVTAGSTTSGIDIMLEEFFSGSISGTITNTSGNPLTGIEVTLFRYDTVGGYWEEFEYASTDGTGQYRYDGIEVGTYRLRYGDPTGAYAGEYHSNAYTVESALGVGVTDGNETVVNAELVAAASISGTVTNNATIPVAGITVDLSRLDSSTSEPEYLSSQTTGANGTYSFGGLTNATYIVAFADYSPSITYAREYYNGKPTINAADPVIALEGQDVIGIDASLDLAGQLSGTVIADANGNPIPFVSVTAHRENEVTGLWDYASGASTNASGVYSMQGLTPGRYRVEFDDISGTYLREFHNNQPTLALAEIFDVLSGGVSVINASLATAGRIAGKVTEQGSGTELPNVTVTAYREISPNLFRFVFSATTDQNGNYSVGGLTAGMYQISFDDSSGYHLYEVYENQTDLGSGTDIEVFASSTTSGIDAALIVGGKISGTVTNAITFSTLQGIDVYFYRYDGLSWQYQNFARTDSAGKYTSPAIPIGQYRVEFYDSSQSAYRSEFYDNTFNFNVATPVTVNAFQTSGSINGALSPIGQSSTIAGTITDNNTFAGLAGIYAQAYLYNTASGRYEFKAEAISDSNGAYVIENLPSGLIRVRFSDRTNGAYAQQFYPGAATLTSASDLLLGTQDSVTNIDASMEQAGTISGTVRNEMGDGIFGVSVIVRRWEPVNNEWFLVRSTQTLDLGLYTVRGLPTGVYRVEFVPSPSSGYYGEFYDDVQTINDATDLDLYVNFGGALVNIDAELSGTPPVTVMPVVSGFRNIGPGAYQADFQGQPGIMYQLERSATMLPTSWVLDGLPFEAQSGVVVLDMISTDPSMFWRVREE